MIGREDQKSNDLLFTCSLIEYIARKTKNHRVDVVHAPQNILNAFLDGKISK